MKLDKAFDIAVQALGFVAEQVSEQMDDKDLARVIAKSVGLGIDTVERARYMAKAASAGQLTPETLAEIEARMDADLDVLRQALAEAREAAGES